MILGRWAATLLVLLIPGLPSPHLKPMHVHPTCLQPSLPMAR